MGLGLTFHNVRSAKSRMVGRDDEVTEYFCCAAFGRYWHEADISRRARDVRFRSKADMNRTAASTGSVADDPLADKAGLKSRSAPGSCRN